jgi:hypothetical protein
MKKLFSTFAIALCISVSAQSTAPRFGLTPGKDNTFRVLTAGATTVTPTSSLVTIPAQTKYENIVTIATNSVAAPTWTANATSSYLGDKMTILLAAYNATKTITFSTGFLSSATTMTLAANKKATFVYFFDGASWREIARVPEP